MLSDLRIWTRLAGRYLWGRKLRTGLTVVAIALAVMLVFGLNGLIPAMITAFRTNLQSATGQVDVEVSSAVNDTFGVDILDRVRTAPGVAVVSGSLQKTALLGPDAPASAVNVAGVDPASIQQVRVLRMAQGRFLAPGDGNVIVIPSTLAERAHLRLGDTFELPGAAGSTTYRIVGIVSAPGAPGAETVYITQGAAQQLFIQGGRINVIDVKTQPGVDRSVVADTIKRRLGTGFKLGGIGASDQLFASLQVSENAIGLFGLFALAMGAFIILNTFRTVVSERRRDIGMLRAIGATRQTILGMFLAEALVEGIAGTALGILAGFGVAWLSILGVNVIAAQFLQFTVSGPEFAATTWALAIAMGVGMTLAGGLWPALQASRLTPIEALRPQPPEVTSAKFGWGALAGSAIIAASVLGLLSRNVQLASGGVLLFLVGLVLITPVLVRPAARLLAWLAVLIFPTEGFVAARNTERQPSRAAVTVSVMMISLALIVGIIGIVVSFQYDFFNWLDSSLGADYLLVPRSILLTGGNAGSGPGLLNSVKSSPGIASATSLRVAQATADGNVLQVVGVDPKTYPKLAGLAFTQGDPTQAWDALGAGRAIILNGIYEAQHPTSLGDYVLLQTAEGAKRYKVVGVAEDYLNAKLVTGYISQENLRTDFHEQSDLLIMANRKPNADPLRTRRELRQVVAKYPTFTLYDFAEWRASQEDVFVQANAVFYILIAVIALPSLLALLNTLAMAILERTREIGMMRAVGTTRGQVVTMVLVESLLLSAIGTILGLIAGIWMSYALVGALSASGFPLTFFFPWQGILIGAVAGIAFGVVAALLPARSAARLKIVDALAYE